MKKQHVIIMLVIIVLAAAAVAFMLTKDDDTKENSSASTSSSESQSGPAPKEESADTEDQSEAIAGDSAVEIEDFAYGPETITVKKGSTVTWTNKDSAAHTVTPDEESDAFAGSELLSQGESYSFTFDQAGTYTYHCQPHPQMTAKVVVTE